MNIVVEDYIPAHEVRRGPAGHKSVGLRIRCTCRRIAILGVCE